MKKKYFLALLLPGIIFCQAFDWPVKKKIIISTFCQSTGQDFSPGVHFAGRGEEVYPVAAGEIIFSYEEKEDFSSVPYGLGSFVALWHEGNIQSVYSQLAKKSVNKTTLTPGTEDVLAKIGDTGATIGGNLNLMIFNIEENELLNPIKNLIPFFTDKKKPVIQEVFLKRGNKKILLEDKKIISPGEGEILVHTYDLREDTKRTWELAPYEFSLSLNGQEKMKYYFDGLIEVENRLILSHAHKSFSDVYESAWTMKLGMVDFLEGTSRLTIMVVDAAGNSEIKDYFLSVQKT